MRPVAITGTSKVVGIVGGPEQVLRSLSPAIHNAAFEALGLDWVYLPFPVEASEVDRAVRGLPAAGVRGFNVTMPHKLVAAKAVDRLQGLARTTGAVNTVEVRSGELIGHNTDGEGLVRFLERDLGVKIEGASVLIIGAGGAARSAVAALAEARASSITVLARDLSKAEDLRRLAFKSEFRAGSPDGSGALVSHSQIIVNATPVGQVGEAPIIETGAIAPGATVVDLVYQPPTTRLVVEARRSGASAAGGLGMLLHQAALAFQIWTGVEPPMEAMSAAALLSLKGGQSGAD